MLRNTATSINSNNNNNRNHTISVILALCKLCILHFLTPSIWKMRIKVRFWGISNTQKNYVNLTKTVIKIIKTILNLSLCKLCIFVNLFMFVMEFWAVIRLGTWKKLIVVKIYWWNLCYGCLYKNYFPSSDFETYANYQETLRIEGSKNTTVIFYILEGNILGYASYLKIDSMLLHVKNFSTYIQYVFVPKISSQTEKFQLHNHKLMAIDMK